MAEALGDDCSGGEVCFILTNEKPPWFLLAQGGLSLPGGRVTKDIHSSGIFSLPPELRWDPSVQRFNAAKNKELKWA